MSRRYQIDIAKKCKTIDNLLVIKDSFGKKKSIRFCFFIKLNCDSLFLLKHEFLSSDLKTVSRMDLIIF